MAHREVFQQNLSFSYGHCYRPTNTMILHEFSSKICVYSVV